MARKRSKARKVLEKPQVLGWKTSDADEIAVRQWRGRTEIAKIEAVEPQFGPMEHSACNRVRGPFMRWIRDLAGRGNSCGCVDHRVNGLGTCKHIEGVLSALKKKLGVRGFAAAATEGPQRIEVYLRREGRPAPLLGGPSPASDACAFLKPFISKAGALKSEPDSIARLLSIAAKAPSEIRVSRHFGPWIERERRLATREKAREKFLSEVAAGSGDKHGASSL
jgi:hypothetical protein